MPKRKQHAEQITTNAPTSSTITPSSSTVSSQLNSSRTKKSKSTSDSTQTAHKNEERISKRQVKEKVEPIASAEELEIQLLDSPALHLNNLHHLHDLLNGIVWSNEINEQQLKQQIEGMKIIQALIRIYTYMKEHEYFHPIYKCSSSLDAHRTVAWKYVTKYYDLLWDKLIEVRNQYGMLESLWELVQIECSIPESSSPDPQSSTSSTTPISHPLYSSSPHYRQLLRTIISKEEEEEVWQNFQEFICKYQDLINGTIRELHSLFKDIEQHAVSIKDDVQQLAKYKEMQYVQIQRAIEFLFKVSVLDVSSLPLWIQHTVKPTQIKHVLNQTYLALLRLPLIAKSYKSVLANFHTHILPQLDSPLLASDFLTDSYNLGGYIAILALNSLFILISKHNLNYPSFYSKLYSILHPSIFTMKYSLRFLQLLTLFLTSSYMPNYLINSFIKKLAQLSTQCPSPITLYCLALIFNLLRRHPISKPLIHRPNIAPFILESKQENKQGDENTTPVPTTGILASLAALMKQKAEQIEKAQAEGKAGWNEEEEEEEILLNGHNGNVSSSSSHPTLRLTPTTSSSSSDSLSSSLGYDPFLPYELDPSKTNASQSSLWEIKTLLEHFNPSVSNLAKLFFLLQQPKKDLDMTKYLQINHDSLFNKELSRRNNQHVSLSATKVHTLFEDSTHSIGLVFQLPKTE